jgi:sugar phosphate isomerase/epimerase
LVVGKGTIDWAFLKENLDLSGLTGVIEANNFDDARDSYAKACQIFNS